MICVPYRTKRENGGNGNTAQEVKEQPHGKKRKNISLMISHLLNLKRQLKQKIEIVKFYYF
jgi:hypothetical protein